MLLNYESTHFKAVGDYIVKDSSISPSFSFKSYAVYFLFLPPSKVFFLSILSVLKFPFLSKSEAY